MRSLTHNSPLSVVILQDGVVSDIEILRGLTALSPGLAASDVGFLLKYFKTQFRAETEALNPVGIHADSDTTGGLAAGVSLVSVADWVTKQPGGHESSYKRGSEEDAEGSAPPAGQTVVGDRMTWTSRAHKFTEFRNQWEGKHGSAASKELTHDQSLPVDGPTWTRADPQPFRVLHLAVGAPPSPRAN